LGASGYTVIESFASKQGSFLLFTSFVLSAVSFYTHQRCCFVVFHEGIWDSVIMTEVMYAQRSFVCLFLFPLSKDSRSSRTLEDLMSFLFLWPSKWMFGKRKKEGHVKGSTLGFMLIMNTTTWDNSWKGHHRYTGIILNAGPGIESSACGYSIYW